MQDQHIPFNRPYVGGNELLYLGQAVQSRTLAGDGPFTKRCCRLLESQFRARRVLLTHSCTAALEMAAMLCDIASGDEVILPAYTFVSTANAFVLRGARPVFVDIRPDTLNLDERLLPAAISERTKVIVPVHYGGVACAMETIMPLAKERGLLVVEDAAQGVDATCNGQYLGTIGHLGCYSFHQTKNIVCGEGGALIVNDERFVERAEIIREKGTNRRQFERGEVDRYAWVDIGSSFLASELAAAYLLAQLEMIETITAKRRSLCEYYAAGLASLRAAGQLGILANPPGCRHNGHLFCLLLHDRSTRDGLIEYLRGAGISAVFHYVPLHTSPFGRRYGYAPGDLPVTEALADRVLRLPCFFELGRAEQDRVITAVKQFFGD